MPYNENEYKVNNVNYLNKDFSSIKESLIEYTKTYFPNTYRDFNETSPGMMLMEMTAYVGDVLSYYIDQQYKEMMLPLAEERTNVINIAKMLGYRIRPINPAYVTLRVSQEVDATGDINLKEPDLSQAFILDKGMKISSTADSNVIFETLSEVDFTVTSSVHDSTLIEENTYDENGFVSSFKLTKDVRAISGETKTKQFTLGSPSKFLSITIPDSNVIEILDVYDSNNNRWYEVDYLAQDKVAIETFYYDDERRSETGNETGDAFRDITNDPLVPNVSVPYSLEYIRTSKRFITEVNDNNSTSLIFGNGLMKTATTGSFVNDFFNVEQAGITIPGESEEIGQFGNALDPKIGRLVGLGEIPANTVLTVRYRAGGGINSNVPSSDLTSIDTKEVIGNTTKESTLSIINNEPARGGNSGDTVEDIRNRASSHFASQNRCVTKSDYEARILSMSPKFGNIAKVYVERTHLSGYPGQVQNLWDTYSSDGSMDVNQFNSIFMDGADGYEHIPSINAHILCYDNNKTLVKPNKLIRNNLKSYLSQYRLLTDEIVLYDGKVINFGVIFDVVAHKFSNKSEVKLNCINQIINYFRIDKMQYRQPIYTSDLEYLLMGLDGVRAVNYVELTQDFNGGHHSGINENRLLWDINPTSFNQGGLVPSAPPHSGDYGYEYNFSQFYQSNNAPGLILPSVDPAVFELKHPRQNIKGIVH